MNRKPTAARRRQVAITLAVTLSLTSMGGVAAASEGDSTQNPRAELAEYLLENGTPPDKVDALIEKATAGLTVDADVPGAVPVEEYTSVEDGFEIHGAIFEDGSFSITKFEMGVEAPTTPIGGISPLSVSGCTVRTGTGYSQHTNCYVEKKQLAGQGVFRADYTLQSNGTSIISKVYNYQIISAGGTWALNTFGIVTKNGTNSSPGKARLAWTTTFWNNVGKASGSTVLRVSGSSAWTE